MLNCRPRTGVTCLFEMTFEPNLVGETNISHLGRDARVFWGTTRGKGKPFVNHHRFFVFKKSLGVTSMKHLLRCENFLTLLHPIVFEGQPLKTRFFSARTRVIKGFQVYIHIFLIYYIPFYWLLIGISSFFFVDW